MFNYEDILAQMKTGVSAEAIAKEFTDALNKACEVQEKEAFEEGRLHEASVVANAFNNYAAKYYKDKFTYKLTAEDIDEVFEALAAVFDTADKLLKTPASKSVDDIFNNFFKMNGILS